MKFSAIETYFQNRGFFSALPGAAKYLQERVVPVPPLPSLSSVLLLFLYKAQPRCRLSEQGIWEESNNSLPSCAAVPSEVSSSICFLMQVCMLGPEFWAGSCFLEKGHYQYLLGGHHHMWWVVPVILACPISTNKKLGHMPVIPAAGSINRRTWSRLA
jgi:hypothetical protein